MRSRVCAAGATERLSWMNVVQYAGKAPVTGTDWIAPIPAPVRNTQVRRKNTRVTRTPPHWKTCSHLPSSPSTLNFQQMEEWPNGVKEKVKDKEISVAVEDCGLVKG